MGIREHFEKQLNEETKISDLNTETIQESDWLVFDPETEISQTDMKKIEERLDHYFESDYIQFVNMAAALKMLFPEKKFESVERLNSNSEEGHASRDRLKKRFLKDEGWFAWLDYEIVCQDNSQPDPKIADAIRASISKTLDHDILWNSVLGYNAILKIAFPNNTEKPEMDERFYNMIEKGMARAKRDELKFFASGAAYYKILFPEKFQSLDIDQDIWNRLKDELKSFRRNEFWTDFVELAMAMKIITADKIQIAGQELELRSSNASYKLEKTKRPERKSF